MEDEKMDLERKISMASEKLDRRVRKTRALLQQGLIQLMKEKEIQDISVKELSDLVDLNRGTFYLHYSDIYDMLNKIEDEIFLEFNTILDSSLTPDSDSPKTTIYNIFCFLKKHWDLVKVMLGPHGDLSFVTRLQELASEKMDHAFHHDHSSEIYHYYKSYVISGIIGIIQFWLSSDNPLSPEEMAEICSKILTKGLNADTSIFPRRNE